MQSTFSRTRHSSKIWAPDISFASGAPLARWALVVVDIGFVSSKNEKGHWLGLYPPPMASLRFFSEAFRRGRVRRPE